MSEQETIALIVLVGVLFTAVTGVVAAVLTSRQKATESVIADNARRIATLEGRIEKLESRDRAWANYVHRLRTHIVAQLPPPPPEWPKDLDV